MKIIETERLLLEPWQDNEEMTSCLYEYAKDPEVGPPAGWKPHENKVESHKIIKELFIPNNVFAIRIKESGRIIGTIGFEADKHRPDCPSKELGYSLARDCWGKGYATEAAKAVIDYGFQKLGLEIIAISTGTENRRSQSVIKKCGFLYEGTQRRAYRIYDGSIRDSMCFSLLREEWEAQRGR